MTVFVAAVELSIATSFSINQGCTRRSRSRRFIGFRGVQLESQLREATGGDPGANVSKMMGEFTETMGQPAESDGNLFAAMKEYEDKLMAAEQENAALRSQLAGKK